MIGLGHVLIFGLLASAPSAFGELSSLAMDYAALRTGQLFIALTHLFEPNYSLNGCSVSQLQNTGGSIHWVSRCCLQFVEAPIAKLLWASAN